MIKLYLNSFKIIIKHSKMWGLLYILISILDAMLVAIQLFLLQNLINQLMNHNSQPMNIYVGSALVFFVLSYVSQSILRFAMACIDIRLTKSLFKSMNKLLFDKINKIDYSCYEDEEMFNVIQRMGDSPQDKVKSVFLSSLSTLNSFVILVGTSLIFFQASYLLTISLLLILLGVIYCSTKGMNILNSTIREQTTDERLLGYFNELLFDKNSVLELTIFRAIPYVIKQRKTIENLVLKKLFRRSLKADAIYNISTILIVAWVIYALFYCGNLLITGDINIGLFVALVQASVMIIGNIEVLAYDFSDTIHSIELVRYYHEFIDLPERECIQKLHDSNNGTGGIIFKNVSFHYPGTEKHILKNVSFQIGRKEKAAIVGANGAGKSTIIKLLLNLYNADEGEIEININMLSPVFQDYVNYYLTVRENVALSDIVKIEDDSSICDALSKGQASDMITLTEKKLETNLGKLTDDGIDISGGQWQRLAVSRGLFPADAFIILDEPTASMDPIVESQMYNYFLKTLKDQGCLIISHRLASARLADKILVLHNGSITEQGTHSELIEQKGLYYQMFSSQASWYGN